MSELEEVLRNMLVMKARREELVSRGGKETVNIGFYGLGNVAWQALFCIADDLDTPLPSLTPKVNGIHVFSDRHHGDRRFRLQTQMHQVLASQTQTWIYGHAKQELPEYLNDIDLLFFTDSVPMPQVPAEDRRRMITEGNCNLVDAFGESFNHNAEAFHGTLSFISNIPHALAHRAATRLHLDPRRIIAHTPIDQMRGEEKIRDLAREYGLSLIHLSLPLLGYHDDPWPALSGLRPVEEIVYDAMGIHDRESPRLQDFRQTLNIGKIVQHIHEKAHREAELYQREREIHGITDRKDFSPTADSTARSIFRLARDVLNRANNKYTNVAIAHPTRDGVLYVDLPVSFASGVGTLDTEVWNRISPEDKDAMESRLDGLREIVRNPVYGTIVIPETPLAPMRVQVAPSIRALPARISKESIIPGAFYVLSASEHLQVNGMRFDDNDQPFIIPYNCKDAKEISQRVMDALKIEDVAIGDIVAVLTLRRRSDELKEYYLFKFNKDTGTLADMTHFTPDKHLLAKHGFRIGCLGWHNGILMSQHTETGDEIIALDGKVKKIRTEGLAETLFPFSQGFVYKVKQVTTGSGETKSAVYYNGTALFREESHGREESHRLAVCGDLVSITTKTGHYVVDPRTSTRRIWPIPAGARSVLAHNGIYEHVVAHEDALEVTQYASREDLLAGKIMNSMHIEDERLHEIDELWAPKPNVIVAGKDPDRLVLVQAQEGKVQEIIVPLMKCSGGLYHAL